MSLKDIERTPLSKVIIPKIVHLIIQSSSIRKFSSGTSASNPPGGFLEGRGGSLEPRGSTSPTLSPAESTTR